MARISTRYCARMICFSGFTYDASEPASYKEAWEDAKAIAKKRRKQGFEVTWLKERKCWEINDDGLVSDLMGYLVVRPAYGG